MDFRCANSQTKNPLNNTISTQIPANGMYKRYSIPIKGSRIRPVWISRERFHNEMGDFSLISWGISQTTE